MATSWKS